MIRKKIDSYALQHASKLLLVLIFFISSNLQANESEVIKKYNLSICSIFKNEGRFLKEWIEYHKLIGVEHFYLYNIESTDNYLEVLKPYVKDKTVTLIQWPNLAKNQQRADLLMLSTRIPAYENAAHVKAKKETKWLVFVDVDEFLVPPTNKSLTEILARYDDYPGVILKSEYFDASQISALPQKKMVIEHLNLTLEPKKVIEKILEKTIFKPELTLGFSWPPYRFEFKNNQKAYVITQNELRINHYANKKNTTFLNGQVKDKLEIDNRTLGDYEKKILLERYQIKDHEQAIIRYIPEMRKRLGLQ